MKVNCFISIALSCFTGCDVIIFLFELAINGDNIVVVVVGYHK